jgi:hypothetical protein
MLYKDKWTHSSIGNTMVRLGHDISADIWGDYSVLFLRSFIWLSLKINCWWDLGFLELRLISCSWMPVLENDVRKNNCVNEPYF